MKWIILATLAILVPGLAAFPVSMRLEETTGRYDYYSVFGFGISIICLFAALMIFIIGTAYRIIVWRNRKQMPQLSPDLEKELPDWDVEK